MEFARSRTMRQRFWGIVVAWSLLSAGCHERLERTAVEAGTERLAASTLGAVELSPEFALAPIEREERPTSCPSVAFGSSKYLITHQTWYELAGSRFDRQGVLLDPSPIPIAKPGGCPWVFFTGEAWLMVWSAAEKVHCSRMLEDGTVLEPGVVDTGISLQWLQAAAFDGSRVLLVGPTGELEMLENDCRSSGRSSRLVRTWDHWADARATSDGSRFWVNYTETREGERDWLWLQEVSTDGVPAESRTLLARALFPRPRWTGGGAFVSGRPASTSGQSMVVYQTAIADDPLVFFRSIPKSGPIGSEQRLPASLGRWPVGISAIGDDFLVAAERGTARISADGSQVLTFPTVLGGSAFGSDGTNLLAAPAIRTEDSPDYMTRGLFFDEQLRPLSPAQPLRHRAAGSYAVDIVSLGDDALVTWFEQKRVLGVRVAASGAVTDTQPLVICPTPERGSVSVGRTFPVGSDAVVICTTQNGQFVDRQAQRVSPSGPLPPPVPVMFQDSVVASDGIRYVSLRRFTDYQLPGIRLLADSRSAFDQGTPEATVLAEVVNGKEFPQSNAIVHTGASFLIAESYRSDAEQFPIAMFSLSNTGTLLSTSSTNVVGKVHELVWNGQQGALLFENPPGTLQAVRVSATGTLLEPGALAITNTAIIDAKPSLAWDGATYWVGWKDSRRGSVGRDDMFVARVTAEGELLDPGGVELARTADDPARVAWNEDLGKATVALGAVGGRALAVYTRFDVKREVENSLLHARWLDTGEAGGGTGAGTSGSGAAAGTGGVSGGGAPGGGASGGGVSGGGVSGTAVGGTSGVSLGGEGGDLGGGAAGEAGVGSAGEAATGSAGDATTGSAGEAPTGSAGDSSIGSGGDSATGSAGEAGEGSGGEAPMGSAGEAGMGSAGEGAHGGTGARAGTAGNSSGGRGSVDPKGGTTSQAGASGRATAGTAGSSSELGGRPGVGGAGAGGVASPDPGPEAGDPTCACRAGNPRSSASSGSWLALLALAIVGARRRVQRTTHLGARV